MKKILPEFEFTEEQLNTVRKLAKECGLCEETVKILYGRELRDRQSIHNFMHPSKSHFISPFKMSGMREAVELITRARDEDWAVVVYGDYDADGICAATVLGKCLQDFGIQPYVCVPERRNGYGLSTELIDEIFDEYFPQLFITVDCGISCADEVEYIKEQGAEVIVTDHHELPDKIPDCICINPKFNDGYIYDNLCGAGVAFKLGCALNGESAYNYLDFTAIATVADSVPLTGENRDIVSEGLKLINSSPSKCYLPFLNKSESNVTSQTLAFSVAPKINAAGRMGDAKAALQLFNETDDNAIFELSAKLTAYNMERQKYCDELYMSVKEMLSARENIGGIIMLCNENWNSGFVGIVAARIADEFSRPTILFVKNGNMLKGSARSVESVNIYEALKACSEYISEFGGHSQAAGVNVTEDNFVNLERALDEYISTNYKKEDFEPVVYINGTLNGAYSVKLAKELEALEPYGVGNKRPAFALQERETTVRPVKALSPHISIKSDKIELMYFGGARFSKLIESAAPKKFIFEYNVSSFRGKEYVKGFVRDVIYDKSAAKFAQNEIALNALSLLSLPETECNKVEISRAEVNEILQNGGAFGTVFIAFDFNTLALYNTESVNFDLFTLSAKNSATTVLLSPVSDVDLSGFKRVVFLDNPVGVRLASLTGKTVEICGGQTRPRFINNLSCERDELLKVFAYLSANANILEGATAEEVVQKSDCDFEKLQLLFALKVFEQLSLISFADGRLSVCRGVKTDLSNSVLYNTVKKLQAE